MATRAQRPQVGYLAGELPAEDIRALERLGADSLWAAGHVATGGVDPEAVTSLTRLALITERATIGTAILLLPLYQPAIVAKQLAEIDRFSAGRVAVGIGVGGEFAPEFSAAQVPTRERGRRTDEAIAVLRALWSGEEVTFAGEFTSFSGVRIHPLPVQAGGPPVIVGGRTEHAWRRAALRGDGWLPFLLTPRRYREQADCIRATAATAGRALDGFRWMHEVIVNVDDDPRRGRAAAMAEMAARDHALSEELFDRFCAAGPPDAIAETLQAYLDAGARHLVLCPTPMARAVEMAEAITAEVIPQLQLSGG